MDVPLHAALQLAYLVMIMVLRNYCVCYSCVPVPIIRRRISGSNLETHYRWGETPQFSYEVIPLTVKPLNKVTDKDNEEQ